MIMPCTCKHDWQDKTHGPGMRVFNELSKDSGSITAKCTVCGTEKSKASSAEKEKKKGKK